MIPADHPQRRALSDEVHARPPEALSPPVRLSYLVLFSPEDRAAETACLNRLLARHGAPPASPEENYRTADLGPFRLRWERHTEFVRYTFIAGDMEAAPFASPVIGRVPDDWLASLPGQTIAATHAVLASRALAALPTDELSSQHFGGNPLIGSRMSGGAGTALTDFRIHADGFGRLLVYDHAMTPRQAGRLAQRLLEIDTYRIMALLALPVARQLSPVLRRYESDLVQIANRMQAAPDEDEPVLLERLTGLQAEIERRHADTYYRFSAAAAYYDLVGQRIAELREQRIEGLQTFREFNDRRLAPAMATCRSISARQAALSERVARATVLLNTRVDLTRERQNQSLLKSMDRRADLQLRLQQTVEGLSVAAITYYIVGLVNYGAKSAKAAGWSIDPDMATGLAIPVVAAAVWLGLRRLHRSIERRDRSG